jgi:predicted nucleic acid-binding protein
MTVAEAEQYLATVFRPLMAVHSSQALYGAALRLSDRYRLPWYDSLILAAALEGQCSVLYSEDLQHGQRFEGLQVQNPFL